MGTGKNKSLRLSDSSAGAGVVSIESASQGSDEKKMAGWTRRFSPELSEIVGMAVLFGVLALLQRYEFTLFHTLGEIFSVVIAGSIFMLARITRDSMKNGAVRLLGAASLSIGIIDLLHTLA